MVEGVATTDDLATASVPDTATQEVALEDGTDPLLIQDVEKVNPSSIIADAPVIEIGRASCRERVSSPV